MTTAPSTPAATDDGHEIVKWYTRARRFPQLIGKTPDGATIWGGPYTYTQVIVGVAMLALGSKTAWLWGQFGLIVNALLLIGGTYGVVVVIGRLPVGSRNPLSVGAGLLRALGAPTQGNLGGARVRIRRPHRARSRLVITPVAASPSGAVTPPPRQRDKPARLPRRHQTRPASPPPPVRSSLRPTPARAPRTAPTPALTGVQRLLASAGRPQED